MGSEYFATKEIKIIVKRCMKTTMTLIKDETKMLTPLGLFFSEE
jgi:hypothetical protein